MFPCHPIQALKDRRNTKAPENILPVDQPLQCPLGEVDIQARLHDVCTQKTLPHWNKNIKMETITTYLSSICLLYSGRIWINSVRISKQYLKLNRQSQQSSFYIKLDFILTFECKILWGIYTLRFLFSFSILLFVGQFLFQISKVSIWWFLSYDTTLWSTTW